MDKARIDSKFMVCGHRGYAAKYPENTLISFEAARKTGVPMIETDIGLSSDGILMLCHDNTLDRTSDGHGLVNAFTCKELKQFNMAAHFPDCRPQRMMTLEEFLIWARQNPNLLLNIDLKHYGADIARKAAELTDFYGLTHRAVFNGLNGEGLAEIYRLGLYTEASPEGKYTMENFDYLCDGDRFLFDSICIRWTDISPEYVRELKQVYHDVEVWSYGVDEDIYARRAIESGVSLVLSNDPFPAFAAAKEYGLQ